jgi:hypothetical protein
MYKPLVLAGALLGLGLVTSSASATPIGIGGTDHSELALKVAEHDCKRDERGWHYMEKDRRRDCRPKRPEGREWGWKCESKRCGWWHAKEKHWHDG